jgi:hypothetical protein
VVAEQETYLGAAEMEPVAMVFLEHLVEVVATILEIVAAQA